MSFNVKNKIMLAVLAGNMLCMGQGLAYNGWYGDPANPNQWKGVIGPNPLFPPIYMNDIVGRATGANLVINGTGTYDGVDFSAAKYIFAGYFKGNEEVTGNQLTVTGGTFANGVNVHAGYGDAGAAGVSGNILKIIDCSHDTSSFSSTYWLCGGYGANGVPVSGNKVWITGGNFVANTGSYIYGGRTAGADATGNVVIIEGGTFDKPMIYGGHGSNAIDNIVEIAGGTFDTDGFELYGGSPFSGTSSGNILKLKIQMRGKARIVSRFQIMNFTLPVGIADGDTMLNTQKVFYDNTTVGVEAADGVTLKKDDKIYLIKADDGGGSSGTISNDGATVLGGAGQISLDNYSLILTMLQDYGGVPSGGSEDQQKAPVEGIAAGVAMINQSADLASGEGMQNLLKNTSNPDTENNIGTDGNTAFNNINTFGAVTGSRTKYKTGSHVDVDGWGFLVGVGTTKEWTHAGKTTYGIFFEYGKGDFDTYNNDIHGEGDSKNEGVGIMARHTLNNNTYFDANIRYGKQETEWSESEIGGYDTDSRYYGAAVGLGHVYPLENNDELDVYVRYSYGHVGACDAKVKDSDYHFDRVLSQRLRLGAKYNFVQKDNKAKPYIGMAWERELKGESRATITGVGEAPAPSLKGNTGIMQAGCDWETGDWILGVEANAYIGKRKGWSGTARAFYNF